jgi:hypothetical protein
MSKHIPLTQGSGAGAAGGVARDVANQDAMVALLAKYRFPVTAREYAAAIVAAQRSGLDLFKLPELKLMQFAERTILAMPRTDPTPRRGSPMEQVPRASAPGPQGNRLPVIVRHSEAQVHLDSHGKVGVFLPADACSLPVEDRQMMASVVERDGGYAVHVRVGSKKQDKATTFFLALPEVLAARLNVRLQDTLGERIEGE